MPDVIRGPAEHGFEPQSATVPRGEVQVCWGCNSSLENIDIDYCEVCRISLALIRHWLDQGITVNWTIPEWTVGKHRRGGEL